MCKSLDMSRGPLSAAVPAAALRTRSSRPVCTGLVVQDPRSERTCEYRSFDERPFPVLLKLATLRKFY